MISEVRVVKMKAGSPGLGQLTENGSNCNPRGITGIHESTTVDMATGHCTADIGTGKTETNN